MSELMDRSKCVHCGAYDAWDEAQEQLIWQDTPVVPQGVVQVEEVRKVCTICGKVSRFPVAPHLLLDIATRPPDASSEENA